MAKIIKIAPYPTGLVRAYAAIVDAPEHPSDDPLPNDAKLRRAVIQWIHDHGNGNCGICGTSVDLAFKHGHPGYAQLDHIVPRSLGGSHTWGNTQISHAYCNNEKNMLAADFPTGQAAATLLAQATYRHENESEESIRHLMEERQFWVDRAETKAAYLRQVVVELTMKNPIDPGMPRLKQELEAAEKALQRGAGKLATLEIRLAGLKKE